MASKAAKTSEKNKSKNANTTRSAGNSSRKPVAASAGAVSPQDLGMSAEDVLIDYRLAYASRQASLIGRREVMAGKAKFGIFGDGKEIAQLAMSRVFRPGDFRSGYYRDQTLIFALGIHSIQEFFAQLYAHANVDAEPASGGRAMNAHFGSRLLDDSGQFLAQLQQANTASDISPTGSQMPRLVGLAQASSYYRQHPDIPGIENFSRKGEEIAFGTIGNATCAEGMFWESVNAIGVLGVPAIISIWDDGYGISVSNEFQLTKGDPLEILSGFERKQAEAAGYRTFKVPGWDYPALVEAYQEAEGLAREQHIPSIIHVFDLTQPQGHSTSGSHERYKSKERLAWESEFDALAKMRAWILSQELIPEEQLSKVESELRIEVEGIRESAWNAFVKDTADERDTLVEMLEEVASAAGDSEGALKAQADALARLDAPSRENLMQASRKALSSVYRKPIPELDLIRNWRESQLVRNRERYGAHLLSTSPRSPLAQSTVELVYEDDAKMLNGFEILTHAFGDILERDPRVLAFGEDLGKIGGVNQGFRGLQERFGTSRVSDTGIRETTIIGQAIGLAMRGLRPIAEIQYLDYLLYALQIISDDLATLRWRSAGGQAAPVVIRTRGHRLEGIWHAGSPMAGIIHLCRGVHVCVPRDMTRAAGFYNTLMAGDDPGLVVEVLSGYRLKEALPSNLADFRLALGECEILREGKDITLVTYGACCRIAMAAATALAELGVELEIIDVQTLLPFDRSGQIGESIAKTGRVIFMDEDVPGGTTAYMLQQVIEKQRAYYHLDSEPRTLSAQAHRPAYGSDGDYFSKPNPESLIDLALELMNEADPERFPLL